MQTGLLRLYGWKPTRSPFALVAALCAANSALAQMELVPTKGSESRPLLDNPSAQWGPDYTNWVEVSAGSVFTKGSKSSFEQRFDLPARTFGGLESLHWETPINKDWLFQLDGRAIFNSEDYNLKFNIVNPKKGFFRGGYREFRTWYDQHGGFSPLGDVWLTPFSREGHIDRGEAWFEVGYTPADAPKFTFGYSRVFRNGSKDSTSWGDATVNLGTTPAISRKIIPSVWDIDETRNIFRADASHTIGNTDVALGLRAEFSDQRDTHLIWRNLGEKPPVVTPGSERAVTQKDNVDTDMFSAHATSETRLNEKVLLTSGFSFMNLNTDLSGSRVYGADLDPVYDFTSFRTFPRRQPFDEGYLFLTGGSNLKEYLFNLNLGVTPSDTVTIIPSIRVEKFDENGSDSFTETTVGLPPGRTFTTEPLEAFNDYSFVDVTESIEARYAGLRNWSFYSRAEWLEGDGAISEQEVTAEAASRSITLLRDTDSDRFTQKYTLGANWYPLARLSFGGQYYFKSRENDYEQREDSTSNLPTSGNRYPAYLDRQIFDTHDANFRITWRPRMNLSLVTRYDLQLSTFDTQVPFLGKMKSADTTSHIISQSVSWSPLAPLYLQGTLNYVLDSTHSGAEGPSGGAVQPSENNYWIVSTLAGYRLNEKTDLQAQYYYYRAGNYQNNSAISQPYGESSEENGVTATVIRQITKAMRWSLKYGFFTNHDRTYGGNTDYQAHLVYSTIQYRF